MPSSHSIAARLTRLRALLSKERVDAFVLFVDEGGNKNVRYLSGFSGTSAALIITRERAYIATDARYTERARSEAGHCELMQANANRKFSDIIAEISKAARASISRIGYEGERVSVLMAERLAARVKKKWIPLDDIVGKLRQIKDAGEIAALRRACRSTSRAFADVAPRIRAGTREIDVAREIDMALRRRGAIENSFSTIVASGPNAAIPHHNTNERRLRPGETVVLDFGGRYADGYCSDLTRTIFVPGKKPDPELRRAYDIVLAANRAAARALRPGMSWKEYDGIARSYIAERGYGKNFTHALGHSVGLEAHDPCDYRAAIRARTVLTDEPGIYLEGRGGVRIEDDLVVTSSGAERLTNAPYIRR
ncbi:aminopeptidase P family protein [Candidatus Parcubacteria bacterium]|nr:MAG: aminopeptidase P family protein [Candidatus Parcubacteria bacterium]